MLLRRYHDERPAAVEEAKPVEEALPVIEEVQPEEVKPAAVEEVKPKTRRKRKS